MHMSCRIIFVTGTDTGVGKTLLTALLIRSLRQHARATAMKPFCSGGPEDVDLLWALQEGQVSRAEINPFYFPEPVAPLVSARLHRRRLSLQQVTEKISEVGRKCDVLLVEGSGGLLVPLGEDYSVLDLIRVLRCDQVLVVSQNRLGTINHTLLTTKALEQAGVRQFKVVLMEGAHPDFSSRSNARILRQLVKPAPLLHLPYLGPRAQAVAAVKRNAKKFQKTLARLLD